MQNTLWISFLFKTVFLFILRRVQPLDAVIGKSGSTFYDLLPEELTNAENTAR